MKKLAFCLLLLCFQFTEAQTWISYYPTVGFDINAVAIPGPGAIVVGGGQETNDSMQIMFRSDDYGQSWIENEHDGLAPWNKSLAFANAQYGFGAGNDGRIIQTNDGGLHWGFAVTPVNRDWNKIVNVNPLTYFVAGGNRSNDSVQSILKTSDGGANWSLVLDQPGPWLKSIYFTDTLSGIAVGDSGVILKTANGGAIWTPVSAPVKRDFNGVTFVSHDTGYIVGGNNIHQSILRTIDGGLNWTVVLDVTGGMLNDVSFADVTTGYAVGNNATVLKTMDGGINWLPVVVDPGFTGNEEIRAVKFYNAGFGVIAGMGGLLYVYSPPLPYSVFQSQQAGSITYSSATLNATVRGLTVPLNLSFEYDTTPVFSNAVTASPALVNDTLQHTVSAAVSLLLPYKVYYYRLKGVGGGNSYYANTLTFYTGSTPLIAFETKTATEVTDTSAVLNGKINGFYYPTPVQAAFEFGTTELLGSEISAGTVDITDTLPHFVSAFVSGLSADTAVYYYRLKVTAGLNIIYGDIRRLQISTPEIPNWDFQHWSNTTVQLPSKWVVSGNDVQQVAGYSVGSAIRIGRQAIVSNCRFATGANGNTELYAGQPFHYRPDSLIFYASYNLVAGDSAIAWMQLYGSGHAIVANNIFFITGNSGGAFKRFSFPVTYNSSAVPDTLILAFTPVNFNGVFKPDDPANFIVIDEVSFSPAAPAVNNGSFETWFPYNFNELQDWNYYKYLPAGFSQGVDQPTVVQCLFAHPDDYGAEVQVYAYDGNFMDITMGYGNNNYAFSRAFAVNGRHQSFNGYYQYAPENGDSLRIYAALYNNGLQIGNSYYSSAVPVTAGFVPFDIPIHYYPPTSLIPDSAAIEITAGLKPSKGNSKLRIDKVSFDGLRKVAMDTTVGLSINHLNGNDDIRVYPNPSKNYVTVEWNNAADTPDMIQIMDVNGRTVKEILLEQKDTFKLNLNVSEFKNGVYFLRLPSGPKVFNKRIVVMN